MRVARLLGAIGAGSLLLALCAVGVAPASSSTVTNVTYAYDFPSPDFELTPMVVAQDRGYFQAAGLDVKVVFPPNTSTTTDMLSVGSADIGFLTTTDMGVAINAGAPVEAIANFSMSNNWALFAKPGTDLAAANLHSILKGKRIFSYGDTWTESMLPYVLKYAGLTESQVKIITDPTGNDLVDLLAGKVDFSTSTTNYEIPGFEGSGHKGHLAELLGTAVGAPNIPIWVYATTHGYASAHPGTVKAFLAAVRRATLWAVANPGAAATDFDKAYPKSGYTDAYNKEGWALTIPFLTDAAHQYFSMTNAQWTTLADSLKSIKLISVVKAPSAYYTNQFLP